MSREGVPQPVRTEAGKVGQVTRRLGHQALDAAGGEPTSALVSEQRAGDCPSRKGPPIRRKRPHGMSTERHDPLLSSLAQNRGDPLVQIHIVEIQIYNLRNASAG